jgi:hypothetical protein
MVLGGPQSHVVSRINCVLDSRALHSLITNLHIRRDEVPLIVYSIYLPSVSACAWAFGRGKSTSRPTVSTW